MSGQRQPAAETGYAFIAATRDLCAELRETRVELKRLREALAKQTKATDDNSDLLDAFGRVIQGVAERLNVVRGLGSVLGGILRRGGGPNR